MSVNGIKNALEYIISNNNLLMDKVEQNTQFCQWLADQQLKRIQEKSPKVSQVFVLMTMPRFF